MAHAKGAPCRSFWEDPASRLIKTLQVQTRKEPPRGWAFRLERKEDYDSLLALYYEMLLAIKQPSDIPNHWGTPSSTCKKLGWIPSKAVGDDARAVLKGLAADGQDADPTTKLPYHSTGSDPRYGTPNWLEKHGGRVDGKTLTIARNLLRAIRDAMGR